MVGVGEVPLAGEADADRPLAERGPVERGHDRRGFRVRHFYGGAAADERDLADVLAVELRRVADEREHDAGRTPRRDGVDVDEGHEGIGYGDDAPGDRRRPRLRENPRPRGVDGVRPGRGRCDESGFQEVIAGRARHTRDACATTEPVRRSTRVPRVAPPDPLRIPDVRLKRCGPAGVEDDATGFAVGIRPCRRNERLSPSPSLPAAALPNPGTPRPPRSLSR